MSDLSVLIPILFLFPVLIWLDDEVKAFGTIQFSWLREKLINNVHIYPYNAKRILKAPSKWPNLYVSSLEDI